MDADFPERVQEFVEKTRQDPEWTMNIMLTYAKKLKDQSNESEYPESIETKGQKALYDNLNANEEIALEVDRTIITKKADSWRGNTIKERVVNTAIKNALKKFKITDDDTINSIFEIVKEPKNGY